MQKPKFLLLAGTGWSATTPLWMTLKEQGILNTGLCKEPQTLTNICFADDNFWAFKQKPKIEYVRSKKKHSEHDIQLLLGEKSTLDDYVTYYQSIVGKTPYVGDFSNDNAFLPGWFISVLAEKLKEVFDVKVLMIFRDPVRRSYSYASAAYGAKSEKNSKISSNWDNNDPKSRFEWRKIKKNNPDSITYWKNLISMLDPNMARFSYVDIYKKYKYSFDTLPIVMEDLWGGKTEELEDFLGCKLDGLHRNCYYPEKGTQAPQYEELPDQYMSDMQDLSAADYQFGRNLLRFIYEEWEHEFGANPW